MEVEAAGDVGDAVGEGLMSGRVMRVSAVVLGAMIGAVLVDGPSAAAQEPAADTVLLTLNEAVSRAVNDSEEVRLARARVRLADAQVRTVRSQALPQVNLALGYTKTLASAFDTGGGFELPDSLRFDPDTTASLEERVRYLERAAPLAGLGGIGSLFGDLPFGQENAYTASVSGSQVLYSGGRVGAALSVARSFRSAAGLRCS
jgi:outer membrane protein TolC